MKNIAVKKRNVPVFFLAVLLFCLAISWGLALAKTSPDGQTVDTVLFYVTNDDGDSVLVSQIPISQMDDDLEADLIDDTVHNYSMLDSYVTTVHQEAQGFTVEEFVEYAQAKSTIDDLQTLGLGFNGEDSIGLWTIDKSSLTDSWTYNELYGVERYNYPQLYQYWDYTTKDYYDPDGLMSRDEVLAYLQANAREEVFLLSVRAFSQRYIETDSLSGYNMENLWNSRGLLDNARTIRAMKPMTAAELANRTHTANDSRYWIWYLRLDMDSAPNFTPLGSVAAPTGYLTEDADNYYVHFYCETAGANIYYNHNYKNTSYMPTALYDEEAPLTIAKSSLSNGSLTITAHAVKDGYTDAGVVTLNLSVGADCPQISANEAYIVGQDMALPLSNSDIAFSEWAAGLNVKVNGTALTSDQYTLTESALTIHGGVIGDTGVYSIVAASEGYATQTLQGVNVYHAAPQISVTSGYWGDDLEFTFSDENYQSQATLMVKADGATAYASINTSYLQRSQTGKLILTSSYFSAENTKLGNPGVYSFKITNAGYWPQEQEVVVTLSERSYAQVSVGSVAGSAGDTVDVPVTITGNPGFAGFTFEISYDSGLTLNSISKGAGSILSSESGSFTANVNTKRIVWADSLNTNGDGSLFVLRFTVSEDALPGDSFAVSLSLLDNNQQNFVDQECQPVYVRFQSGAVSIPDGEWDGITVDTRWYDASSGSFTLNNAAELAGFAAIVNGSAPGLAQDSFIGKTVMLNNDLNLGGHAWTPIGTLEVNDSGLRPAAAADFSFNGTFDGNNKCIEGLYINGADSGVALFANVGADAKLQDLTVSGSVSGAYFVGGIVAVNAGELSGLINRVEVSATNDYVGGIAAECVGQGFSIMDCHNRGLISNSSDTRSSGRVGGIVGRADSDSSGLISRCSNTADIYGYQYVAGIIGGQFGNVEVEYCYNTGNITGVSFGKVYLGGIAGKSEGGTIANCYNTGDLTDLHWAQGHVRAVGGIAGCEEGRDGGVVAISNCYTTGSININTDNMVYGSNWIYETGNISGGNSTTSYNTMLYENCFYLEDRIAIAQPENASYQFWADVYKENPLIWDTVYIQSKTEAELKFTGNGSEDILTQLGGAFAADTEGINSGYPILAWQSGASIIEVEYALSTGCYPVGQATISLSASKAQAGTVITVSVTDIASGKQVKSVQSIDAAGNRIEVTAQGGGEYTFTMPKRGVTVLVTLENSIDSSAAFFDLMLPQGLDAIWSLSADSTYRDPSSGQIKAGATVYLTVNKAEDAAMTSLEGVSITSGGENVSCDIYSFSRDATGSGYQGVYIFTMPAAAVEVSLDITYGDFKVYTQTGSGEKQLVKTYSRADMLALSAANLYYSGYASETEAFIGKAEQAVTLGDLLSDSGLTFGSGQSIEVAAADGMNLFYTYEKLYGNPRYYYPNLVSGTDAAAKADGKTEIDAMFVIKGYMATASEGDVEQFTCDTLNAYRFVYGQSEEEFNNGQAAVEYKVIGDFPKYASSLTVITPSEEPFIFDWNDKWDWDTENYYDISWYDRESSEFHISTNMELAGLAWIVNQGDKLKLAGESSPLQETFTGKTVYLDSDIYLNDHDVSDTNNDALGDTTAHQWPSIAGGTATSNNNALFNGTFDGQGHVIYNLYIFNLTNWEEYDARNRGLFGVTAEQAVIRNLNIEDGFIRAARSTGAVVGKTGTVVANSFNPTLADGHGTVIENCHNRNTTVITTDSKGVGGIVGAFWNYPVMRNCSNSGAISSIGPYPAGGIAGESEGTISYCFNSGPVSSAGNNAGGIVGSNDLTSSAIISCYNTGNISSGSCSGGIAGYQKGTAQNCYNLGVITGPYAGAIFGEQMSSATNSGLYYQLGSATTGVGKLSSGTNNTVIKTAEELKAADMVGLLGDGWSADNASTPLNDGYPVLSWQLPQSEVLLGDVNGNGKVNSVDTVLLARYLAEQLELTDGQFLAADVNGNGKVNSIDAVLLARYLANQIDEL